jgi:inosine-uridine nucleoside N-ribohydrolase
VRKRVIIDCDPGIDDALAVLLALASDELEIKAITTVRGNVSLRQTTKNLLNIIEIAKIKNLPALGCGSAVPLRGSAGLRSEQYSSRGVHGNDGLGNSNFPHPTISLTHKDGIGLIISEFLKQKVDTLVCLGPLTNIARALILRPELKDKIAKIIVMGGAVFCEGNVTKDAEFNIFSDPEAADIVFKSGLTIHLVSLDVTKKVVLNQNHLKRLKNFSGSLRDFIVNSIEYSIKFHQSQRGVNGMYLHDPLAVGIAVEESLGNFEPLCLGVDLGVRRGKTYVKDGPFNVQFCKDVDKGRFMNIFLSRLEKAIQNANY